MVLVSHSGFINIKNHYKIRCIEKSRENQVKVINPITTNKYHGLLENKFVYEPSDDEEDTGSAVYYDEVESAYSIPYYDFSGRRVLPEKDTKGSSSSNSAAATKSMAGSSSSNSAAATRRK